MKASLSAGHTFEFPRQGDAGPLSHHHFISLLCYNQDISSKCLSIVLSVIIFRVVFFLSQKSNTIVSLIDSFIPQNFLRPYYVSGIVIGVRDTVVRETPNLPRLRTIVLTDKRIS